MDDLVARWTSPSWRANAEQWIHDQLAGAGLSPQGPVTQVRVRFWSTQLTVETAAGRVWFKENSPPNRFEAALTAELDRLLPGSVLPPLAVDPARGWLLLPDGGRTLHQHATDAGGPPQPQTWAALLSRYGALQVALVGQPSVPATGVPMLSADATVAVARSALEQSPDYPAAHPLHRSRREARALAGGLAALTAAAAELDALGMPDSLQHNDLHPGNAFADAPRTTSDVDGPEGSLRFFDFGDALWAPPLCSLLVPVAAMTEQWGCAADDARITAACEGYLRAWAPYVDPGRVRASLPAAHRIAAVHRHEAWRRVLDATALAGIGEIAAGAGGWLRQALT